MWVLCSIFIIAHHLFLLASFIFVRLCSETFVFVRFCSEKLGFVRRIRPSNIRFMLFYVFSLALLKLTGAYFFAPHYITIKKQYEH